MTIIKAVAKPINVTTEAETRALAKNMAECCTGLAAGVNIHLLGQLGAGKTAFARGFIQGLGYSGRVKSPTYTLVESYQVAGLNIHHFDLYRLCDPEELEFIGIRDYTGADVVNLIEWPGNGTGVVAPADLEIRIDMQGDGRKLQITGQTEVGNSIMQQL